MIMAHGGETVSNYAQQQFKGGSGIVVNIQFPNVTSFQDWMAASPALIKEVTERKILTAFKSLENEGKISKGTVLI
jgi:hypothetical protein